MISSLMRGAICAFPHLDILLHSACRVQLVELERIFGYSLRVISQPMMQHVLGGRLRCLLLSQVIE
jgi:hypothetical protein